MSGQLLPSIYNMILISEGGGGGEEHSGPADEKADIINQVLYLFLSFLSGIIISVMSRV